MLMDTINLKRIEKLFLECPVTINMNKKMQILALSFSTVKKGCQFLTWLSLFPVDIGSHEGWVGLDTKKKPIQDP